MASRMKEDEKNEMIIRGLLMLHANLRCIDCNSLFPSMASYQGSVPNMTALRNLLCSCSFGTPSLRQIPSQQPSYLSSASPSPYMMQLFPSITSQHVPNDMVSMVHQGIVSLGSEVAAFGSTGHGSSFKFFCSCWRKSFQIDMKSETIDCYLC